MVVDPRLKDMTGYVAEYGYRGTLGKWLSFDVGGFYIRYNDRLGRLTTQTSTGPTFFYTNISNSRNIGLESYLEADLLALARGATGRSSLFVFSSVAPISARYREGPVTGNRVEFSSSFIGRWGGTYRRGSFSGTLQYSYTGDQFTDANNTVLLSDASQGYIPEQRVMDSTMNYGFQKNYVLTVSVSNLLIPAYPKGVGLSWPRVDWRRWQDRQRGDHVEVLRLQSADCRLNGGLPIDLVDLQ